MTITYTVCPIDYKAHLYQVTLEFTPGAEESVQLRLPAWIPGSYMIREFAKNIVQIHVTQGEEPLCLTKDTKDTWSIFGFLSDTDPVKVQYTVYAWDLSVRTAHLDQHHGFFNGTSLFLEVIGANPSPIQLHITGHDDHTRAWKVATGLTRCFDWNPDHMLLPLLGMEGLRFEAANYDELIDHPVEMGHLDFNKFTACGTPHYVVSYGAFANTDWQRLCKDLTPVCEHHIKMFEPSTHKAPFAEYWFLIHATDNGYGGLEHRNSTALLCSRKDLPHQGLGDSHADYRTFLGLCSHEYFHAWNVKRIKPAAFIPYDLTTENYTRLLWVFEGFTSYYDDLALVKSGVISKTQYLDTLGKTVSSVLKTPGRHLQSVADSSFDAWTKYYRQDENAQNAIISYYNKGALVALCLDILIRRKTKNQYSLDDAMRALWQQFGKTDHGLPEGKLAGVILQSTGVDLAREINHYAYATDELPIDTLLQDIGHVLSAKPCADPVELGMTYTAHDDGLRVKTVRNTGAAHLAGLAAGDVIVAIDGYKASADYLKQLLAHKQPHTHSDIVSFRREKLHSHMLEWQAATPTEWTVSENPAGGQADTQAPWLCA